MALMIVGHPNFEKSFANKTIVEELQKHQANIEIRNIQQLYPDFKIDIKKEQNALLNHQTLILQYPFYWYSIPGILKHWLDVVFEHQFAYGSNGDKLKNKNFVLSFTVGAPEKGYTTLGDHHFPVYDFCKNMEQTAYYAQMNFIKPFYFHGTSVTAGYSENEIKKKAKYQANKLISLLNEIE